MTEPFITAEEVEELFAKLESLELSDPQRALLSAILKVAGDVTEVAEEADERPFSDQFATSFTPHHAALVVAYAASSSLISRAAPPCPPVPPGSATPALISRSTTPGSSQP
ncbi:hypothetical protein AB0I91_21960 [Actinosynnema sp. NPDC049800]